MDEDSRFRSVGKRLLAKAAKRGLVKAVPVVGTAFAASGVANRIREKGWVRGGIDAALDLTPVVGRAKALYEFFRGDLIDPPGAAFDSGRVKAMSRSPGSGGSASDVTGRKPVVSESTNRGMVRAPRAST